MKCKKILALVICGAVTLGMLGGCSAKENEGDKNDKYSLSEVGKSMMPILHSFCKWGIEHMPNDWEM